MIEWFSLQSIGKSAARFDYAKLENLNGHYLRTMSDAGVLEAFLSFLPHVEGGPQLVQKIDDKLKAKLVRAMPGLKERAKTLLELKNAVGFLFDDPEPDAKARDILNSGGVSMLRSIYPVLAANSEWTRLRPGNRGQKARRRAKSEARPNRAAAAGGAHRNQYLARHL